MQHAYADDYDGVAENSGGYVLETKYRDDFTYDESTS
jgi:hypothetical protein